MPSASLRRAAGLAPRAVQRAPPWRAALGPAPCCYQLLCPRTLPRRCRTSLLDSVPEREGLLACPDLVGGEDVEWAAISNLDAFFVRLYRCGVCASQDFTGTETRHTSTHREGQ